MPNTFCLNFGSYIRQNPIQLFDNIFHPFLEGGGGVKAIPSTAAAVKNTFRFDKFYSCEPCWRQMVVQILNFVS